MKVKNKVSAEDAKQAERLVRRCVTLLRKKEYELNIPKGAQDEAVRKLVLLRRSGAASRGGAHIIKINRGGWHFSMNVHTEYKSFNKDPVIGSIEVRPEHHVYDHMLIIIAHEVAHHIQYRYCPRVKRFKYTWKKPHGKCFKDIYRYLRRDLVNPVIRGELKM